MKSKLLRIYCCFYYKYKQKLTFFKLIKKYCMKLKNRSKLSWIDPETTEQLLRDKLSYTEPLPTMPTPWLVAAGQCRPEDYMSSDELETELDDAGETMAERSVPSTTYRQWFAQQPLPDCRSSD